jgi:tetratricopeptide (TPR) repeat protein
MKTLGVIATLVFAAALAPQRGVVEMSDAEFPATENEISSLSFRGLRIKEAAARIAGGQVDPETARALFRNRRFDEGIAMVRTIVETQPEKMAATFAAVADEIHFMMDRPPSYGQAIRAILAEAPARFATLPREQAAETALALISLDSRLDTSRAESWHARVAKFVQEYAGTETAVLAEVDLITQGRLSASTLEALDRFAAARPGTTAAAKALYTKGFNLASNGSSLGERAGSDPTERFFGVVAVVRELRGGRYPASPWLERAEKLIFDFNAYQPKFASGNPERMLAVYEEELPRVLRRGDDDPTKRELAYFIADRMGKLFAATGDPLPGVEGVFDRLERVAPSPDAVKLLRARFYLSPSGPFERVDRVTFRAKAITALESIVSSEDAPVRRKTLATLAKARFDQGQFDLARDLFRRYEETYPSSGYAWVAALRMAQCEQMLGNNKSAIDRFDRVADRYRDNPLAIVLARAYAGRLAEAEGDFARALERSRAALNAWDPDYGSYYVLSISKRPAPNEPFLTQDESRVTKEALAVRVDELTRSLAVEGGALLERGRWFLARERSKEAEAPLTAFLRAHSKSPLATSARLLLHRAALEQALDLLDADKGAADVDAATKALTALAAESPDFVVCAAKIALGTVAMLRGADAEANALMADAMRMWQALDPPSTAAREGLERDILEIRNAVFRPKGDRIYRTAPAWNAFEWKPTEAPFVVFDPELRVKSSDGRTSTVVMRDPFPDVSNVVFLDKDRKDVLGRVMLRLGGTKRHAWTQVMQTPNQPAGPSLQVLALWKRSFFAQPGHWGGWVFETYPIVNEIEFINKEQTRAAVRVTVGYSGCTVQIEKRAGIWVTLELTNFWIT